MTSTVRFFALASALILASSCASKPNSKQCGTGIFCPEEMQCAAVQHTCLTNGCGNGVLEPGEECDDGNIIDGDRCSAACRLEVCGNGVIDVAAGEVCDDGNTRGGDGCSADCKSKELCGNGVKDEGEACDDGNMANGDGCSGASVTVGDKKSPGPCKSTEVCGNGIIDVQVGEVCDDGNTISGDGCNSDCRSGEGCGNGIVDPGEQCDDGNSNDNDNCRNDCTVARCGDGVVNLLREQCDGGDPANPKARETAECNSDCTMSACGDGKINKTAGENCDDGFGNNKNGNNCNAKCVLDVCGDGVRDTQAPRIEECDDGNTDNNDGCSNDCRSANCGNGIMDPGEECDDGNDDNTDLCAHCHNAVCGDGFLRAGSLEECDDGNTTAGDGCSPHCRREVCGNGVLDPGEQCDDGNTDNTDACLNNCRIAVCGDNWIRAGVEQCDDGNLANNDGCSSDCHFEGCGNGIIDPGEQCDDGNSVSGDGCSSTCLFESCGDGVVNKGEKCDDAGESANCNIDCTLRVCGDSKINRTAGEECDDGSDTTADRFNADDRDCTATCKVNVCGDGHIDSIGPNHKEACDDHNTMDGDGCSSSCRSAACGNGMLDPHEQCDDGNTNNGDGCSELCTFEFCGDGIKNNGEQCDGGDPAHPKPRETVGCNLDCTTTRCGDGKINHAASEECDDGDDTGLPKFNADDRDCTASCKDAYCGDHLTNANGPVHKEECDDSDGNNTNTCNNNCAFHSCGDGVKQGTEECDDGNLDDTDGCLSTCFFAKCGDGKVWAGVEECDPADTSPGHPNCSPLCTIITCGNGILEAGEQCDDGNTASGDGCSGIPPMGFMGPALPPCHIEKCGDGVKNNNEPCDKSVDPNDDDESPTNKEKCNFDCTLSSCGDGKVNPDFVIVVGMTTLGTEQCDDKNSTTGDGCVNCRFDFCGNNHRDGTEECDGSDNPMAGTFGCSADCHFIKCGNGVVEPANDEECDDGVNNSDTGNCLMNCKINVCGDGHRDMVGTHQEDCDDGTDCTDGHACNGYDRPCLPDCTNNVCGDGFVQTVGPGAETCDDGNTDDETGCDYNTPTCTFCSGDCMTVLNKTGSYCGDGHPDLADGEQCDDGNTVTETACPYDMATCPNMFCSGDCKTKLVLTGPVCGDGKVDEPYETCDDGNATCGSCSADCQTVELAYATGYIVTVPVPTGNGSSANIHDADNFTIDDGLGHMVTFEFDNDDMVAVDAVKVTFGDNDTATDVANSIVDAINNSDLLITAVDHGALVSLTHQVQTSLANNLPITHSNGLSNTDFFFAPLDHGLGGDCPTDVSPCPDGMDCKCEADTDCQSGNCVGAVADMPGMQGSCMPAP